MGFLRRLFGRDFEASTVYTGRVLTADTTIDSGLKWASPLPTPASAGQVIKSTGAVEGGYGWDAEYSFSLPTPSTAGQVLKATGATPGAYAWGTDFQLPAAASMGQVLTATGTNVGDYAWSAAPSNLWFTHYNVYEDWTASNTFVVAPWQILRILLISSPIGVATIYEGATLLLKVYAGGINTAGNAAGEYYDASKVSLISMSTSSSILGGTVYGGSNPIQHPLFTRGAGYGGPYTSSNFAAPGGWIDAYYRNTTGSSVTLNITIPSYSPPLSVSSAGACLIQYN